MRLDDMDAKLDRIEKQTHTAAAGRPKTEPAKPSDSNVKADEKRVTAKAPAATKRATAKQAQPNKRTARKGTR